MRHEIPAGWVELCEPEEVTERARRPISYIEAKLGTLPGVAAAALTAEKLGVADADQLAGLNDEASAALMASMGEGLPLMDEMNDLLIIARLRDWSFPKNGEPWATVDALLDLPSAAYKALRELCSSTEGIGVDAPPDADPKASTPNSDG